jgi:hypothetical protein
MLLGIVTSQECEEKLSTGSVQDKNSKPRDKTLSKPLTEYLRVIPLSASVEVSFKVFVLYLALYYVSLCLPT